MDVALLNQRVTIQQRTTTQDAIGQPVETWATVATVWASVRHLSGIESIKASADVSVVKASIRIRYRTGVDAGMRVVAGSATYDIQSVMTSHDRAFLDLPCLKVA